MTAPSSMTMIRGIVPVVPIDDRQTWGILRGRRSAKSLWIVPGLWKTPRTRFPQARWTRTERAPTRSTRRNDFFFYDSRTKQRKISEPTARTEVLDQTILFVASLR